MLNRKALEIFNLWRVKKRVNPKKAIAFGIERIVPSRKVNESSRMRIFKSLRPTQIKKRPIPAIAADLREGGR